VFAGYEGGDSRNGKMPGTLLGGSKKGRGRVKCIDEDRRWNESVERGEGIVNRREKYGIEWRREKKNIRDGGW
jgi:hypothetical protein